MLRGLQHVGDLRHRRQRELLRMMLGMRVRMLRIHHAILRMLLLLLRMRELR